MRAFLAICLPASHFAEVKMRSAAPEHAIIAHDVYMLTFQMP